MLEQDEQKEFEWDEEKRLTTLEKHGIDFFDAAEIFETDYLLLPAKSEIEHRLMAVGKMGNVTISVIHMHRDNKIRIITARRARQNEREEYQKHVARRDAKTEKSN